MLLPSELSRLQSEVERVLSSAGQILHPVKTYNQLGQMSTAWVEGPLVSCYVAPARPTDQYDAAGDRITAAPDARITVPFDAGVVQGDRIDVGDRVFEIVGLASGLETQPIERVVLGREVQ
jgi:head-tail adaptor